METNKNEELFNIAQGVADVTQELMYDSVTWQLSDFEQDGDDFNAIHAKVLRMAIEIMFRNENNASYRRVRDRYELRE